MVAKAAGCQGSKVQQPPSEVQDSSYTWSFCLINNLPDADSWALPKPRKWNLQGNLYVNNCPQVFQRIRSDWRSTALGKTGHKNE